MSLSVEVSARYEEEEVVWGEESFVPKSVNTKQRMTNIADRATVRPISHTLLSFFAFLLKNDVG